MSTESVQFIEMIREASRKPNMRKLYCEYCGILAEHFTRDKGQWEIYTCALCGNEKAFRVR